MKVLFLDIDGVLTTSDSTWDSFRKCHAMIPECVKRLQYIIEQTQCLIVVSSDWRHRGQSWLRGILAKQNIPVHDITPVTGKRHEEIAQWLQENQTTQFCIVDDTWVAMENLVQTSYATGLCDETAKAIIAILGTK